MCFTQVQGEVNSAPTYRAAIFQIPRNVNKGESKNKYEMTNGKKNDFDKV